MPHVGLASVKAQVEAAARAAGRSPQDVALIAVSKTFAAKDIRPVLDAGHRYFGENRVQEAKGKWPALVADYPGVELHLIGPLQTNKVADAVSLFSSIHSVDRPRLAEALAKEMRRQGRFPELFIQVNTGREAQKAGILPEEAEAFIAACGRDYGLKVAGLMCIPPAELDPRPHFESLVALGRKHGLQKFSMGMSGDYPIAIACGATHVRVGSAIFGHRS